MIVWLRYQDARIRSKNAAVRRHPAVDVVPVEDSRPAAPSYIIVEGAVVLRGPQLLLQDQGFRYCDCSRIVSTAQNSAGGMF